MEKGTEKPKRDSFFDIVKGIGIALIVTGHVCPVHKVIRFLYLFHLPLFFFVSGCLFHEEKWRGNLDGFIGSRIRPSWIRYMIYGFLFVLLHNPMVNAGALEGSLYNHTGMLGAWLNYMIFAVDSSLAGAMWFIPVWIVAMILFAAICEVFRDKRLIAAASVLVSVLGIVLNQRGIGLLFHLQTSFLAVGVIFLGYFTVNCIRDYRKYLTPVTFAVCFAGLFVAMKLGYGMELSADYIPGAWMYLFIALGAGMVMCLAGWFEKVKPLRTAFSFFGRQSFDIMSLHFLVIKVIDILYNRICPGRPESLILFPSGYSDRLFFVYLAASLVLPAFAGYGLDRLLGKIKKIYQK